MIKRWMCVAGLFCAAATMSAVAQNGSGAASSNAITAPVILDVTSQTSGSDITFAVVATGDSLSYQWTWQGHDIPGATQSVLRFANAYSTANAGYYAVRVSNPAGTNVSSTPGLLFTKPAPAGTYQGLFYETNSVAPSSSGLLQYTLSGSKRTFSGKVVLGARRYSFSGNLSIAHDAEVSVRRSDGTPLTLRLQLLTTNDLPQVIGSIGDGTWTALLLGRRLHFSSKNPTPLARNYTLSFQNTNSSAQVPNGAGYAVLVVRVDGTVVLSGKTADGSAISGSFGLNRLGDWPLYVSLNAGRGCLLGWLRLAVQVGGSIQSSGVAWVKTAGTDKLYPEGFSLALQPLGSTYILPASGVPLTLNNGVALFYAGDLFSNDLAVWQFVKAIPQQANTFRGDGDDRMQITIATANGVISGQFTDFMAGQTAPVKGVVLQQQNAGRGYFISGGASGYFNLAPSP